MQNKLKLILLTALAFLFTRPGLAFDLGTKNFFDNPPPVNLAYPAKEEALLAEKNSLEFQWSDDCPIETEGYEFRLYNGYGMSDSAMISRKNLPAGTTTLKISADKFADGSIYTWSVKRIANCGRKSDAAYNSFRVKK